MISSSILASILKRWFILYILISAVHTTHQNFVVILSNGYRNEVKLFLNKRLCEKSGQTRFSLPRVKEAKEPKQIMQVYFPDKKPSVVRSSTKACGDKAFHLISVTNLSDICKRHCEWAPLQDVLLDETHDEGLLMLTSIVDDWNVLLKSLKLETKVPIKLPHPFSTVLRYGSDGEAEVLLKRPVNQQTFEFVQSHDPIKYFGIKVFPKPFPIQIRPFKYHIYRAKQDGTTVSFKQRHDELAWFNLCRLERNKRVSQDVLLLIRNSLFSSLIKELNLDQSCNLMGFFPHLAAIWESTNERIQNSRELLDFTKQSSGGTVKIPFTHLPHSGTGRPIVMVELGMPIQVADRQSFYGRPVLLASSANNRIPGGYFKNGGVGVEEDICRFTNLGSILSLRNDLYPINAGTETSHALYTPDVLTLRQSSPTYGFFGEWCCRRISVCSIPALGNDFEDFLHIGDSMLTARLKERISLQFQIAEKVRAEVLIASDFGFGLAMGKNALLIIIKLYNQVLEEYRGNLKTVIFASPHQPTNQLFLNNIKGLSPLPNQTNKM